MSDTADPLDTLPDAVAADAFRHLVRHLGTVLTRRTST